jgi:hypothetical protein
MAYVQLIVRPDLVQHDAVVYTGWATFSTIDADCSECSFDTFTRLTHDHELACPSSSQEYIKNCWDAIMHKH